MRNENYFLIHLVVATIKQKLKEKIDNEQMLKCLKIEITKWLNWVRVKNEKKMEICMSKFNNWREKEINITT